jgi:hypothetical protein
MAVDEQLDDATRSEIAAACHITPEQIEDVYACTAMQLGMFAESAKRAGAYQTLTIKALGPSIDEDRFCAALRQVIAAHAVLRTRIVECRLGIVQVVVNEEIEVARPQLSVDEYRQQQLEARMGLGMPLSEMAIIDRKWIILIHHALREFVSLGRML